MAITYHDQETHANSLANLDELALVGCKECQHLSQSATGGSTLRLVQRRMKRLPSRTKSLGISASSWKVSDIVDEYCKRRVRYGRRKVWGIGTGMGNATGTLAWPLLSRRRGRNNYFAGRSLGAPSRDYPYLLSSIISRLILLLSTRRYRGLLILFKWEGLTYFLCTRASRHCPGSCQHYCRCLSVAGVSLFLPVSGTRKSRGNQEETACTCLSWWNGFCHYGGEAFSALDCTYGCAFFFWLVLRDSDMVS
jgi:hypothetical protein